MDRPILVLNAGSSTLKYATFVGEQRVTGETLEAADFESAVRKAVESVPDATVIGHRVVHGGDRFTQPVRVTSDVLAEIEKLTPLAPLHQPKAVAAIKLVESLRPGVPQVACFDTAFHATMHVTEKMFALPRDLFDRGVRRYGFHGLSYEFIAGRLREIDPVAAAGSVVVCHLGSGASLCGMIDGKSVTTTMGFTPLDGLMMATRSGRLDPGVVLYLIEHEKMTPAEVGDLLEHRSGLLGVSGVSGDLRKLLDGENELAGQAVGMFYSSVAREIAAMIPALAGLDAIVFTGGIGEHGHALRLEVCLMLSRVGVRIDSTANEAHRTAIHDKSSKVKLFVLPTDEEAVIARHCRQLLGEPGV